MDRPDKHMLVMMIEGTRKQGGGLRIDPPAEEKETERKSEEEVSVSIASHRNQKAICEQRLMSTHTHTTLCDEGGRWMKTDR